MNKLLYIILLCVGFADLVYSQEAKLTEPITLDDAISLATNYSADALLAKHRFKSSFWSYRSFKASMLPQLALNGTVPSLNRNIEKITDPTDGSDRFIFRNSMSNGVDLNVSQNIFFTGGTIGLSSGINRIDNFGNTDTAYYGATPVSIRLSQSLNGYNSFKWARKIEPLKYEQEKKAYLTDIETIAMKAISLFFSVATAQLNKDIAEVNYQNADTLYKIGKGRYNIGIIAEDELLQLELSLIQSGVAVKRSELEYDQKRSDLAHFLNIDHDRDIVLVLPDSVPDIELGFGRVLALAQENNPEVIGHRLQLLQAENSLAKQKSEKGLQADLQLGYNLNQHAATVSDVYRDPNTGQTASLSIKIPLLDWGQAKGQYKMAKSNAEVARVTVEQAQIAFEQQVLNAVSEFNFESEQFLAACKADTVAQMRFEISKQRYMIGKINTLQLNDALTKRDGARRAYLSSVQSFWSNYYALRKLTLFDFMENKTLSAQFDEIVHN